MMAHWTPMHRRASLPSEIRYVSGLRDLGVGDVPGRARWLVEGSSEAGVAHAVA